MAETENARPASPGSSRAMRLALRLLALLCACLGSAVAQPLLSDTVIGGVSSYCVRPGDTLSAIAARHAEPLGRLLRDNGLQMHDILRPARCLRIENRKVVPADGPRDGVLIDIPQRMLYLRRDGALSAAYPASLGRVDWPTPTGDFRVTQLRRDPVWHVPRSIREEAMRKGTALPAEVPSGPANPLGHWWIGLDLAGYGIHGTNRPWTVGRAVSHGCIRLRNADVEALFELVRVGTPVAIVGTASRRTVYEGDRGSEVREVQARLGQLGLYAGAADGVFGSELRRSVERFQARQGLEPDGIVGPATYRALGLAPGG